MPGTAPACTLWQRINVMQALRALSGDAYILYFLFTTYDLKQARLQPCHALHLVVSTAREATCSCLVHGMLFGGLAPNALRKTWSHEII